MHTNRLGLDVRSSRNWSQAKMEYYGRILVDGNDLIKSLESIEKPYAEAEGHPELAGMYFCPIDRMLPPSRHLLGESAAFLDNEDGRSIILLCDCSNLGCWDFDCKITVAEQVVTWSDFRQRTRPEWDYSKLGSFVFDRQEYERVLQSPLDSAVG